MTPHPNALVLERVAAGTLAPESDPALAAHLAGCERCREDLAEATSAHARFHREVFPRTVDRVEARTRPAWTRWLILVGAPLLATAATVLLVVPHPGTAPRPSDDHYVAAKGGPALSIVARRGDQVFRLAPGTRVRTGDELRFVVSTGGRRHALVASVDGRGTVSVYVPWEGARSMELPGDPAELPGSVVLDATPGDERVFLFLADAPFDAAPVRAVLAALAARGPGALAETTRVDAGALVQDSVLLERETP